MIELGLAILACAIWLYLLVARGRFWRSDIGDWDDAQPVPGSTEWPDVIAIVPARDEAPVIEQSLHSLLAQDYPGRLRIIVVDDNSSDETSAIALRVGNEINALDRLTVLAAPPPDAGWTGKLGALQQGLIHIGAMERPPRFVWFTDADIVHTSDNLRALVARAIGQRLVLVSLMAKLRCESVAECALIPAFVFFFQMLYPFRWVNSPTRTTAAAAGGCMLVDRAVLHEAGGIARIRGALIDDCALARLLKGHGRIWLGLTRRARSIRAYGGVADIRPMIVRSAYAQLRYSPWLLAGTVAGMTLTFITAPMIAMFGSGIAPQAGIAAWLMMILSIQPTLRLYRIAPAWGIVLPLIALIYLMFTVESAYQAAHGRAGRWKGRVHTPSDVAS